MNQNHYYTNQPNSKSQEKHFSYVLKGFTFQFASDNGVFSKNTIDFANEKARTYELDLPQIRPQQ